MDKLSIITLAAAKEYVDENNSGALDELELALNIDHNTYIMTLQLKKTDGTVLSSQQIDFPLESMVIGAKYSDGQLTLTLQNGKTLEPIDISAIVGGLVKDTFTIAGIDMKDDITKEELKKALGIDSIDSLTTIQAPLSLDDVDNDELNRMSFLVAPSTIENVAGEDMFVQTYSWRTGKFKLQLGLTMPVNKKPKLMIRSCDGNGVYGDWIEVYSKENIPTVDEIGAMSTTPTMLENNTDINTVLTTGLYYGSGENTYKNVYAPTKKYNFFMLVYANDDNINQTIYITSTDYANRVVNRTSANNGADWSNWHDDVNSSTLINELRTQINCKELTDEDLNTITKNGFYYAEAGNTISNKPHSNLDAFVMYVNSSKNATSQLIIGTNNGLRNYILMRQYTNGNWTWTNITHDINTKISLYSQQLSNQDLNKLNYDSGFFYADAGNTVANKPSGVDGFTMVVNNYGKVSSQIIIATSGTNRNHTITRFTTDGGETWTEWDLRQATTLSVNTNQLTSENALQYLASIHTDKTSGVNTAVPVANNFYNIIRMNMVGSAEYWTDIAFGVNSSSAYYRRITNGADFPWIRFLDSNNYKDYVSLNNLFVAENHRNIFTGRNLGTSLTEEQKQAITSGTFDNMFIGDYWTINNVKWIIADFDYWLNTGDNPVCTKHHVVVVSEKVLYNHAMNDDNITEGAYVGSKMYTEGLSQAKETINAAFGEENILSHREYLTNAVASGHASASSWYDSTVELMNERMVYGNSVYEPNGNGQSVFNNYTIDKTQLSLFRLKPSAITIRALWWLRDVVSASGFAIVGNAGGADYYGASFVLGVRPAFGIC